MQINKTLSLPKMHNEFKIKVIDSKDGSQKEYKAYNVVLNQTYQFILENSLVDSSFSLMVGRGTGVTDPSRSTLYSQITSYSLINIVGTVVNKDLYTLEGNIVIPENALIGETITEIGLYKNRRSPSKEFLINHAQLKDSAGNPISIGPKTGTQKIEIYSTLYAERGLGMKEFPNPISKLLSKDIYARTNADYRIQPAHQEIPLTWTYNAATKTATSSLGRLAALSGQMLILSGTPTPTVDILEITSDLLEPIRFPNADVFPTFNFSERKIGVGDGVKTEFNLESGYFKEGSINLLMDGVIQTKGIDYITQQGGRQFINYKNPFIATQFGQWTTPDMYRSDSSKNIGMLLEKDAVVNKTFSENTLIFDFKEIIEIPDGVEFFLTGNSTWSFSSSVSDDGITWVALPTLDGARTLEGALPVPIKKLRYLHVRYSSNSDRFAWFFIKPRYGIKFTTPPPAGKEIRASWSTDIPPKNENLFYDLQLSIKGTW